jgi:hypothetical protein
MKRTRGHVATIAVSLLLGSVIMAGCGTQRADSAASSAPASAGPASTAPPSAVAPTPSADDFVASVMRTRDLSTADLQVTVTTDVGDSIRTLTGTGEAAVAQGYGDMQWTDASGAVTRELSNGKGLFVQTDVPDGMWTRLPDERSTPTARLVDPLRGLGALQAVSRVGAEDFEGSPATRYTGTLPASEESLALLGFSDEELVGIGADWQGGVVEVIAWTDDRGRVVGIERSLVLPDAQAGPVSARTMTLLSDFTTAIDLAPPPTESVVEAPEGQ